MNFNQAEEEYIDGEDTIGLGTLGKEGSGRYANTASSTAAVAVAYTVHDSGLDYWCHDSLIHSFLLLLYLSSLIH